MLQISFREFYLENILDFLWRQWSAIGVAGSSRTEDIWTIDPEALIIFSLQKARYEPRLFDEILDWLVVNGKWIDIQRLRGIIKTKDESTRRLLSAVSAFLCDQQGAFKRKWRTLSVLYNSNAESPKEDTLFISKSESAWLKPKEAHPIFKEYGFIREKISLRRMTKPVPITLKSNIRFLLRSLFGIGSRAECMLYLLTHEAGHPSEIAKAVGISVMAIRDVLFELAGSGLILTRQKGKRTIEYWLSQKRWWEFLSGSNFNDIKMPVWLDWISLFSALDAVWNVLNEVEMTDSGYLRSSKLREAMETISGEFSKSGLDLPAMPNHNVPPERYEEEFQLFITKVLGARSGPNQ